MSPFFPALTALFSLAFGQGITASAAPDFTERPAYIIPEPREIITDDGLLKKPFPIKNVIDKSLDPEAYELIITPREAFVKSSTPAGRLYGHSTLDQLISQFGDKGIPCGTIKDSPRYPWRGLMLDPARHFIPVSDIRKFIDVMAYYKFNRLHLHLTDDQGWRLPVPGYPRLKTIASHREETNGDDKPHGGMYTKQELKDLVRYAAAKNVEIIPEVDAPGHNVALAAAYPEFICFPNPNLKVFTSNGVTKELVCPGNPDIWRFYTAVIKELKDIFPSRYIHLGGDEAPEDNWMKCPKCAAWRKAAGIAEPKDGDNNAMKTAARQEMIQFFSRLTDIVNKAGKEPLFWYEQPIASYPKGSTVYTWRLGLTPDTVARTRKEGLKLIFSPGEHCYLDYPQLPGDWPKKEPAGGWMPTTTLEQTYKLDPGRGLTEEDAAHIVGVEATMWGECIPDINKAFYMAYPRALALSEAGWSPADVRSWERFQGKLDQHRNIMQKKWNISLERPAKK